MRQPEQIPYENSALVSFGLLSTAIATIWFGSRTRIARSSRVPFVASATRGGTVSAEIRCRAWSRATVPESRRELSRPRLPPRCRHSR